MDFDKYAEQWRKNYEKSKSLTKQLNDWILSERQKKLYLAEKGYIPEVKDYPEWKQAIERSRYVKEVTEANPTSTHKKPGPKNIKPAKNPKPKQPWTPPKH